MMIVVYLEVSVLLIYALSLAYICKTSKHYKSSYAALSLIGLNTAINAYARSNAWAHKDIWIGFSALSIVSYCLIVSLIVWSLTSKESALNVQKGNFRYVSEIVVIVLITLSFASYTALYLPLSVTDISYPSATVIIISPVLNSLFYVILYIWRCGSRTILSSSLFYSYINVFFSFGVIMLGQIGAEVLALITAVPVLALTLYEAIVQKDTGHSEPVRYKWVFHPSVSFIMLAADVTLMILVLVLAPVRPPIILVNTVSIFLVIVTAFSLRELSEDTHLEKECRDEISGILKNNEFVDYLTLLHNRSGILHFLNQTLSERDNSQVAIIQIDIDGFNHINESFGIINGDRILRIIADRLRKHVGPNDIVARLGADIFAVALIDCHSDMDALNTADSIRMSITQTIEIAEEWRVNIDVSMGVVIATSDDTAADIMRFVDAATYRSKLDGRGQTSMLSIDDLRTSVSAFSDDQRLRSAISLNRFTLHVQPVVDLPSGKTVGFEALARWPDSGISPAEFIPLIEESGLSDIFGRWVLGTACKWAVPLGCEIAVNISPRHMHSPRFVEDVINALQEYDMPGEKLILEITERSAMPDIARTTEVVSRLRQEGIRIAVDDFGTGEFSLQQLMDYPLDVIKIDRSFVFGALKAVEDLSLIESLIHAAEGLGFYTIAEGVEDEQLVDVLINLGADQGQGYFWSKPMPLDEGVVWWNENHI